jgi:hypothetical protein
MALLTDGDRVKDTTTTTGTGDITLSGTAPSGFRAFASAMAVGDNCYYAIVGGAEWEVGYGTLTASTTLNRSRIIKSSNADALVSFSAGSKDVFVTIPGRMARGIGTTWALANAYAIN